MTFEQSMTFTALPNGIAPDGRLKLSVHITPRLSTDNEGGITLQQFPDLADFATSAQSMSFSVAIDKHPLIPATFDPDPANPTPDDYFWTTIFPPTCPVTPYTVDSIDTFADRVIRSYPAANVATFAANLYTRFGLDPTLAYPSASALLSPSALGQFAASPTSQADFGTLKTQLEAVEKALAASGGVLPAKPFDPANVGMDMAQVYKFHEPPPVPPKPVPFNTVPKFDFHQGLGTLGSHPRLLRQLGIIRDLLVALPAGVTLQHLGNVSVVPAWSPQFPIRTGSQFPGPKYTTIISPITLYNSDSGFIAQPAVSNSRLDRRRLRLSDPIYSVLDFDVDGAALKALGLANNLALATQRTSPSTPTSYSLPAMRTEGLVLIESGLAAATRADLARQQNLHANDLSVGQPPTFFAEDLVRGYHFDVWDDTVKSWAPLCARHVTYTPLVAPGARDAILDVEDEGVVSLAVTSHVPSAADPTPDIRLPETIAKWSGWSIVAPRIGSHLDGVDNTLQPTYDPTVAASDATAIKLAITTTIPQDPSRPRLPSLRYGRSYKFRARAVDVAGNADPFLAQETTSETTPLQQFLRYEPVNAPVILLHDDPTESESVHRLVIRSNYNTAPRAGASIRHLAAPNASQLLVEHSGGLDNGGKLDPTLYAFLAAVDGQKFDSSPINNHHPNPNSPRLSPIEPPTSAGEQVFIDDFVTAPYLSDPFSRGAAVYGLPYGLTTVGGVSIPGGSAQLGWITSSNVDTGITLTNGNRIRLVEGTTAAYKPTVATVGGNRELVVPLIKGSVVTVKVSSYLTPDGKQSSVDIDRMALWRFLKRGTNGAGLSSADVTKFRALIAAGLHWMFTPYEEITLVHAVQQPLLAPTFNTTARQRQDANGNVVKGTFADIDGTRSAGDTVVLLKGNLRLSGRSTSQAQVTASWNEQQDVHPDGPTNPAFTARPFNVKVNPRGYPLANPTTGVPYPVTGDIVSFASATDPETGTPLHDVAQDFHDHKHRMVYYTLDAVSAFAEEFVETRTISINYLPQSLLLGTAGVDLVPGYTRVVLNGAPGTVYEEERDFTVNDPAPGMITFPATSTVPNAELGEGNVVVSVLSGPISRSSLEPGHGVTGEQQTGVVNVLASARPAPPHIEYAVPAYKWADWKATSSTTQTSSRTGNILRVYLARPWYSSGDNEQLAVILPTGTVQPDAQDLADLHSKVSLIGQDPIWGTRDWKPADKTLTPSGPTQTVLTTANFPLAKRTIASGVQLSGTAGVGVAVHDVAFDSDRNLWYSDIEVLPKAGAYTPFVRLALARFQANAIQDSSGDLRLSAVATADIAQLSPTRTLTATTSATGVAVTITGTSYLTTGQTGYNKGELTTYYIAAQPGPSIMICKIQTLIPGMDPATFPDTAWQDYPGTAVAAEQPMVGTITSAGAATWKLTPKLPFSRGTQPMRLAFVEYEQVNSETKHRGRVVFAGTYLM